MNKRACQSDDCDLNHCPKCGSHTLGYLEPFQRCSSCELEQEQVDKFMNEAREIREAEIRRMAADEVTTAELEAEAFQAQFDHDPNPYEGTYSEQ